MPEDSPYDFAPEEKSNPKSPTEKNTPITPELQQERLCPHCGFKMYGKLKARCPECAAPMDTVATDILQFSSTSWTRSLSTGFLLVGFAIILHTIAACLRGFFRADYRAALHLAASLLLLIGVLKATATEPIPMIAQKTYNIISRFAALASLLFWIPLTLIAFHIFFTPNHILFFIILTLLCQATLAFTLALHVNALALRVPNDSIASHAFNAGWIVALSCLVLLVCHIFNLAQSAYLGASFFCSFPMLAGLLVIFLWAAITTLRLAADIRNAATAADAIAYRRAEREAAANKKKK